jgi:glutathione synthase/RimK-type ligase-like ATP-grasp enzyme
MKNFIILRTDKGGRYARKIMRSIRWINEQQYPRERFVAEDMTISEFMDTSNFPNPAETLIHPRCANPRTSWTERLRTLEEDGFTVVNSVDAIELTSNKLACALHLQNIVPHPRSWEFLKSWSNEEAANFVRNIWNWAGVGHHYIIAKPLTSLSQGAHVQKIRLDTVDVSIIRQLRSVPGDKIVVQEFFPYTAMHRVIVIGSRALPYTFVDRVSWHPENWKVSCCLNRTTMRIEQNPDPRVLEIAETTQRAVNGEINFIDIFEGTEVSPGGVFYRPGFAISEINTACSLNIHERLAQEAGRTDWNIHYRIAKHLVRKAMGQ